MSLLLAGIAVAAVFARGTLAAEPATQPVVHWKVVTIDGATADAAGTFDPTTANLVRVEREGASPEPAVGAVLFLRDGQKFTGKAAASDGGESLGWESLAFGKLSFPLKLVRGVALAGKPLPPATGNEDVAVLQNGDTVKGVLSECTADSISLSPSSGDPVKVPWSSVARLSLADLGGKPLPIYTGWQVELADGTVLRAPEVAWTDSRLTVGKSSVPAEKIVTVERLGPAWSLAILTPASVEQHPYLTVSRPPIFGNVRVGGVASRRAIAMSPSTKITWKVPDGVTTFRSKCYVTRGEAKVVITAGDQKVERVISSGGSPAEIQLSVPAGADLTVAVDFSLPSISADVVLSDPLLTK